MTTGVCRNGACANARSEKPVELYPGPGQWCPECGNALDPLNPAVPEAAPFGGLTALEALARFDPREIPVEPPAPAPRSQARRRIAVVAASAALTAVAAVALLRPTAAQRPPVVSPVHVCGSTMTGRLAADVVRAYARKAGVAASRFELSQRGPCDVRFEAKRLPYSGSVIGQYQIVVVDAPNLKARPAVAAALAAYARSADAQAIVARDGFLPTQDF